MVNKYQSKLFLLFIITITFLAYSCGPRYEVVYPNSRFINALIKSGNTVIITTKDEKVYEFKVVEITDDAIVGETDKVLFTDIHNLQKKTANSFINTLDEISIFFGSPDRR